MSAQSQNALIKKALKAGHTITPMDALRWFNCFRLAARINDLRNEGLNIATQWEEADGKHFASYHLARGRK